MTPRLQGSKQNSRGWTLSCGRRAMGQAASHCGNAQACFDVDGQGRMELCDSGGELPAVPQQHRATVPSSAHAASAPHAAARAEHADALPTGHPRASPHGGMVGRNHSVQRSFGTPAYSPCASHIGGGGGVGGVGSEADRMLEELRNMYATPTASRQGALPGDASLLAEKIVRQREMASGGLLCCVACQRDIQRAASCSHIPRAGEPLG